MQGDSRSGFGFCDLNWLLNTIGRTKSELLGAAVIESAPFEWLNFSQYCVSHHAAKVQEKTKLKNHLHF
ncbi:hypothetical protein SPM24T3_08419 [Serratia sp. M24T3]|nr:hypothetical protein SPM24T3_08419 [Serratia sp. M24T3]